MFELKDPKKPSEVTQVGSYIIVWKSKSEPCVRSKIVDVWLAADGKPRWREAVVSKLNPMSDLNDNETMFFGPFSVPEVV